MRVPVITLLASLVVSALGVAAFFIDGVASVVVTLGALAGVAYLLIWLRRQRPAAGRR